MRIIIIINNLTFLVSHRLKIVEALLKYHYQITVVCGGPLSEREQNAEHILMKLGVTIVRTNLHGNSLNLFRDLSVLMTLIKLMFRVRPSIIHGISPKGVLCACFVGLLFRKCHLVLSFSGLGRLYTHKSLIFSVIRFFYEKILWTSARRTRISLIVQNEDDKRFLLHKTNCGEKIVTLLPGSGVDLNVVPKVHFSTRENIVLFPARVILEKGICEFIVASSVLKKQFPDWRFVVAGGQFVDLDLIKDKCPEITSAMLVNLEFLGHVDDIFALFRKSKIVCLPSYYREGLPLALAEGAVHGCAIVTTDNVGCRDTLQDGKTGILVPVKDDKALTKALRSLMSDEELLTQMSKNAYVFARTKFDVENIVSAHLKIYSNI